MRKYVQPKKPILNKNEKMYKYFENRGISKTTVDKFKIFEEDGWYGFQYFDENSMLQNIKYRSEAKNFRQSAGAKPILYNYDAIHNQEQIIFVEGEMDVLSCAEVGFHATSLPNGAGKVAGSSVYR